MVVATCLAALVGCSGSPATDAAPSPEVLAPTASTSLTKAVDRPIDEPLATSRPPRTAVVADHTLTYPDGRTVKLPRGWGVTGIARYGDGFLLADNRYFEGTLGMQRLDAEGKVVDTWTSTGPALVAPDGQVAWVSVVAPESGETGPTLIHVGERTQELSGLFSPYLQGFDGETVTFTARELVRGRWRSVTYETDLADPPRLIGTAPRLTRYYSPNGQNWYGYRRHSLRIATPDGATEIRADRFVRTMAGLFWEDDRHLLGTYVQDGRMAVARIDLKGTLTIASPWRRQNRHGFAFLG